MPLVPSPALVQEQRDAWQFPAFGIFLALYITTKPLSFFCNESKKYVVHEITSGI